MKKTFYGWWVLLAVFLVFSVVNIVVNTFPLLNAELKIAFDWTHEEVSRPPSLLYLITALAAPLIGILLDRYSTRMVMLWGYLGVLFSLFYYYFVDSLVELSLVYIVYALALTSAGQIPGVFILTKWFRRYRGRAIGWYMVGSSFGGIVFPMIAGNLIADYNWQIAALGLGGIGASVGILAFLTIRDKPEDVGSTVDGLGKIDQATDHIYSEISENFSLAEVLRSFTFYLLLLITAALSFCIYSLIQHLGYFFKDLEIAPDMVGSILSWFFALSIVGKISFGYLSDRFSKKNIMLLAGVNMCLGSLLLLLSIDHPKTFLFPTVVAYGIGYSGTLTMIQLMVAEYYQGASYGRILGVVITLDTLAGSLGVYVLGAMRTAYGSYASSFMLMLGVCVVSAIGVLFLRKPTRVHPVLPITDN